MNFMQRSPVTSCLPDVWHQQASRLHRDATLLTVSKTHRQDVQFKAQAATMDSTGE